MALPEWLQFGSNPDIQNMRTLPTPEGDYKGYSPFSIFQSTDGKVFTIVNLTPSQIINDYEGIAPLNTAVNRVANAVAGLPLTVIEKETNEKVPEHPILKLIRHPNNVVQKTRFDLMQTASIWKILQGDVYLIATGALSRKPLELMILNPLCVEAFSDDTGFIQRYEYTTDTVSETYERITGSEFFANKAKNQSLLHIRSFNPKFSSGDLEGESEVLSLYFEINQYLHASKHNMSLLLNGARPSGAFILKNKDGTNTILEDAAFDRLKNEINSQYIGSGNAGRPLVLEGGLEWQTISLSPKDLDFANLKIQAEEQIYANLEVPLPLIKSGKTTANNMSNVRLEFYQNRILPFAENLLEHYNRFLMPRFPDSKKFELVVDKEEIDVLLPERVERRKVIESSLIMTVNEKRAIFKMERIEGGDKIVDPNGRPVAGPDANFVVGDDATLPPPSTDNSAKQAELGCIQEG